MKNEIIIYVSGWIALILFYIVIYCFVEGIGETQRLL
jgi:hypothetical protein